MNAVNVFPIDTRNAQIADSPRMTASHPRNTHWIAGVVAVALLCPTSSWAADSPHVQFDVAAIVGCRDVTKAEFAAAHPSERLVEARIQVSSLIDERAGDGELIEYFYRFQCPSGGVRVDDYQPRTTLDTMLAGNVGIERKNEAAQSAGITVSGVFDHLLKGAASADANRKSSDTLRYELLPPLESLAASGTIGRSTGVYFKLKPSPRTTLEGGKEFVLVLRVPEEWRADVVELRCTARGVRRGTLAALDEQTDWGRARFTIALYQQGDRAAKDAAERFVSAESSLRAAARAHEREIRDRRYPTSAHKFAAMMDLIDPRIPENWFDAVVRGGANGEAKSYWHRLPEEVRESAGDFADARTALRRLNGRVAETSSGAKTAAVTKTISDHESE
jgi:hypothetical protein